MLRPLGIDNTVIVDVFKTMTQAQIDLQTQLEQATPTDLITRPLSNDSPVLYIEISEQTPPTFLEPMEHTKVENENPKPTPPQDDTDHTQSTPPPPKKRYEIMKDPIFLSSPIYPPSIPSKISLCTNRDDHLISILSTDDFVFKAQLTSLYMHPTDYSFRLYDKNQDFFTSIASKIMGPYQYWLENGVKIFSLQFNFLRPSIYDLKPDESDPSFLSIAQKATHHQTYTKFLQYTKPQKHIFVNYKYTSPFTMTNMYTLDHSCITGYLRNYDPIKQYFCLLPYNNTSRPLIVPQEYLIHYDDFCCPATFLLKLQNLLLLLNTSFLLHLTIKIERTIQHSTSKRIHTMNSSLSLPKLPLSWYKLNKKLNINHTLHLKKTLLTNFLLY